MYSCTAVQLYSHTFRGARPIHLVEQDPIHSAALMMTQGYESGQATQAARKSKKESRQKLTFEAVNAGRDPEDQLELRHLWQDSWVFRVLWQDSWVFRVFRVLWVLWVCECGYCGRTLGYCGFCGYHTRVNVHSKKRGYCAKKKRG